MEAQSTAVHCACTGCPRCGTATAPWPDGWEYDGLEHTCRACRQVWGHVLPGTEATEWEAIWPPSEPPCPR